MLGVIILAPFKNWLHGVISLHRDQLIDQLRLDVEQLKFELERTKKEDQRIINDLKKRLHEMESELNEQRQLIETTYQVGIMNV